jgi:hypothetical protein
VSLPLVQPDDLRLYLHLDTIDEPAAWQLLRLVESLCESVVSPLPDAAAAVVLDVATRAWSNPRSAQSATDAAGPFSQTTSFGAGAGASGGLFLTRENKATLRRLTGARSGVFTIDTMPATAGQSLPWWDTGGVPYEGSGFDQPPT